MVTFTDFDRHPLKAGQCVVYAATAGRAAPTLRRGVVSHFTEQRVMIQGFGSYRYINKKIDDPLFELERPRALGKVPYAAQPNDTVSVRNIMVVDQVWPEIDELRKHGHLPAELDNAIVSV